MHRIRVLGAFCVALFVSLPVAAATVTLGPGGDLQTAIDNAAPGDTILLQAGATFAGNFVVRGTKSGITIRSTAPDSSLPRPGQRTGPVYAAYLPKLQSPNTTGALRIEPGASYITVANVEFLASSNGSSSVIELGYADSRQTTAEQAPHHLVFDRILMNIPEGIPQKRGIALNSGDTTIRDSYLYGLKYAGADSQALAGWNGPGPFLIENNRLVAAGENVMFGGGDPRIPNMVPSNIRVLRNRMDKPLSWRGSSWTVKNIFELKNAQDVLIEGNVFEYCWLAAQSGYAIVLTPRNQDGTAPWSVVQRVTFRHNIVRHVSSVFNILGTDTNHISALLNDVVIDNNLFEDVDWSAYGGAGRMMLIDGGDNIRLRNNTSPHNDGQFVYVVGHQVTGLVFENNLVNYGNYGLMGDGTAPGNSTITRWLPAAVIVGNAIVGKPSSASYPAGNYYPSSWDTVAMDSTYRLLQTSPYIAAATDGTAVGANIDAIAAAMAGAQPEAPQPEAPACTFAITPLSHASPAAGDSFSVTVTPSASSCTWTASSNQGWASASATGGTGSGTLTITADANATTAARTATVTVAGSAVTITQAALVAAPACTFTVTPGSVSVLAAATTFSATVTASHSSCGWSTGPNVRWLSVSSAGGSGTATFSVTVAANTANGTRSGTVTAAGQTLSVQQFGRRKK